MEYKAPLKQMKFMLREVFAAQKLWSEMPETSEVSDDLVDAILEEGSKISEGLLYPINRSGDEEGVQWSADGVKTPQGFKEAWQTYAEGGWIGLGGEPQYGGQGMPKMLTVLFEEMLYASNCSFALYSVLTSGAALALNAHGSDELKEKYLPNMYSGQWAGAMGLTEPHAGTDLGIIRSKAEDNGDGSYAITGTKIFITGGEHDLSENIIHLVLAKLPDAPPGPKGISLFLVPKVQVNDDGSLGDKNNVSCGSTEHKMGIHASATCVMNFDGAKGYLVGELNKGLMAMFTMMNYERLSIGLQGLGCGEMSYQRAVTYAKERLQSRAPSGAKLPDKEADPIIVHPDVRRMLMTMRAFIDGSRAFSLYTGMQLDLVKYHGDDSVRKQAQNMVDLLTPVAKAFISDKGLDTCVLGQQVFGGHGYIREWGQEQLVRDVRIAQIYEGTNGIQALDLVRRKVLSNQGQLAMQFFDEVRAYAGEEQATLADLDTPLLKVIQQLQDATEYMLQQAAGNPNQAGAVSNDYLHLFGYGIYAYLWARVIVAAKAGTQEPSEFYQAQIDTGRYFFARLLPQADSHFSVCMDDGGIIMDFADEQFDR